MPQRHVEGTVFDWLDVKAFYDPSERAFIKSLIDTGHRDEAEIVHELKATFGGRIEGE